MNQNVFYVWNLNFMIYKLYLIDLIIKSDKRNNLLLNNLIWSDSLKIF